jgi:hypothetical protein
MEHLSLAEMAKMLSEGPAIVTRACRHLAEVCPDCGEQLRQVEALMKRFGHWNPEVAVGEGLEADSLFAELMAEGRDYEGWLSRIEENDDFQTWGVAWVALERAKELGAREASQAQARDLALLAAEIAERLGDFYHPESVSDLKALAYSTAAAAAAAEPLGASLIDSRLKYTVAAVTALEKGSGEEVLAQEVWKLLSRVFTKASSG